MKGSGKGLEDRLVKRLEVRIKNWTLESHSTDCVEWTSCWEPEKTCFVVLLATVVLQSNLLIKTSIRDCANPA
eukprot:3767744-Amphidinium_carterae.1